MKQAVALSTLLPVVAILLPVTGVQAQVTGGAPSREEITPPTPDATQQPGTARIDSRSALARESCPLSDSAVRATITEVRFSGPGATPLPAEFAPLLQDVGGTGADQPISVVCDIRDRANMALRNAKYVATVQIPPQRIEDGVLRLEIVSARIVEMRVRGDPGPYENVLNNRIELLKALVPLNEAQAEEILLLAGDVPGLDVQLALRPTGGLPGDVIGEMTVSYRPYSVIANVQNYNSRPLGRETAYVRGEVYGLTGGADVTYIGLSSTVDLKEQKIIQVGHVAAMNDVGTTLASRMTYALSKPSLDTIDLKTRSFIASVELAHPLVRSVLFNAGVVGGLEYARQKTTVTSGAGSAPLNLDEISALFVRLSASARRFAPDGSEAMRLNGSIEVRKGVGLFSPTRTGTATPDGFTPSRFEGDAKATVIRAQADSYFALGPIFSVSSQFRAQWANNPLLNYDEFSLGNLTIGRGYDPGSNSGDRAIGISIEPSVAIVRDPGHRVELFGFYDGVRVWNLDRGSTENDRRFRSYGFGARLLLPGKLVMEITYARPQDKALSFDPRRPPDRVLFSLTTQLLPWGGR